MTNRNAVKCTLGVVVAALFLAVTWSTTAARLSAWTTNSSAVKLNAPASAPKTLMALRALVQSAATVATDKSDYHPGETVTVTGSGWAAGETVTLSFAETPYIDGPHVLTTVASDQGNINDNHFVVDSFDGGIAFTLTATGGASNQTATTTFTDGPCGSGTGVVTVAGNGGSCVAGTAPNGSGPFDWEVVQGGSYTMTITGVTECTDAAITVFIQSTPTGNFCFNAGLTSPGVYTGTFTMPNPACETYPISYKCGANADCDNAGNSAINAQGPNGACTVHLRASTFSAGCTNPVPDIDCNPGPQGCTCSAPADKTIECGISTDPSVTGTGTCTGTGCTSTYTDSYAGGDCGAGGHVFQTLTRTWHCTDANNVTTDCPQTITITDTTPPTITTCPQGGNLGCNPESTPSCDSVKAQVVASDACSNVKMLNCQQDDSDNGCIHTRKFTITATDNCNNTSAPCVVTYTWTVDTTPPVITCPTDITVNAEGACCKVVNFTVTATDVCSTPNVLCVPPTGTCFPVGTTQVNCGARDSCRNHATCSFNVIVKGQICATKFYDADASGGQNGSEGVISGWKITLSDGQVGYTGANGTVCFNVLAGTYTVTEVLPSGNWVSTTGTTCTKTISSDNCTGTCTFGNFCKTSCNGLTLGFWTNRNGQNILEATAATHAAWVALLNNPCGAGACLRNADGSIHTFSTYADLKSWLNGATATNMAYMLSVQLAANLLDGQFNGLGSSTGMIVPGGMKTLANVCIVTTLSGTPAITCGSPALLSATSLLAACSGCSVFDGFVTIGNLRSRACCLLAAYGNTTASSTQRTYQECVKDLLDVSNNNGNPSGSSAYPCGPAAGSLQCVSATPCAFTTPY